MPSSRDLPNPGIKLRFPTLEADSLPAEPPGKPKNTGMGSLSLLQGNFPDPGLKPGSPALQVDSLPAEPPGKPKNTGVGGLSLLQGNLPDLGIELGSRALQVYALPAELPGDFWAPHFPQITPLTHSCLYSPHSGELASNSSIGRICLYCIPLSSGDVPRCSGLTLI